MPFPSDQKQYNMTIMYHADLKSGEFEITVDYESPEGTDELQHASDHRKKLTALLEKAGILRGECCLRLRRTGKEEIYEVRRSVDSGDWLWELRSQRVLEPRTIPVENTPVRPIAVQEPPVQQTG